MNYQDKDAAYYSNIRLDLVGLITRKQPLSVLEIGAAFGETLYYLKQQGIATETVGIDLFEDQDKNRYKATDRFIFGNIDELDFPEYEKHFDLILLPDVLEHITEPKKTLEKVKRYLKDGGEIIISMPNIRHYSAFVSIFLKGRFRYEESGLFDYTHVRFYCKKDIRDLILSAGYQIVKSEGSIRNYPGKSMVKIINRLTFGFFEEFFSTQYFFKVKK